MGAEDTGGFGAPNTVDRPLRHRRILPRDPPGRRRLSTAAPGVRRSATVTYAPTRPAEVRRRPARRPMARRLSRGSLSRRLVGCGAHWREGGVMAKRPHCWCGLHAWVKREFTEGDVYGEMHTLRKSGTGATSPRVTAASESRQGGYRRGCSAFPKARTLATDKGPARRTRRVTTSAYACRMRPVDPPKIVVVRREPRLA
jgi:hypothetical protein